MTTTDQDRAGRLTVGQVAATFGVTVHTLHHHDEVGLLGPGDRSGAGCRLYSSADLTRLRDIVVYRRHIDTWFYDLDHVFHVNLAGLARFVHDAIIANAARHRS